MLCIVRLSFSKKLILIRPLEINVPIIPLNERGSQYMGLFPRQEVRGGPLEEAVFRGVQVGLNAVEYRPLSVLGIPVTYQEVKWSLENIQ